MKKLFDVIPVKESPAIVVIIELDIFRMHLLRKCLSISLRGNFINILMIEDMVYWIVTKILVEKTLHSR